MTTDQNQTGNIMLVDDTVANLKLLELILGKRGHRVRSFPRGRLALAAAAIEPPDLILLDVNMPEMNGYELCERLKADPALARIPVIFISASNEMLEKGKAFSCGGVDYISKPFQIEEILARLEHHLRLTRLQTLLDQSVSSKTGQLAGTNERLAIMDAAKNDFLALLARELRPPAPGLLGVVELLVAAVPPDADTAGLIKIFEQGRQRVLRILEDAVLFSQMQADSDHFAPVNFPLSPVLTRAMDQAASLARERQVVLPPVPGDLPPVSGNALLLEKALVAVIETAVKYSNAGQAVELSFPGQSDGVEVVLAAGGSAARADGGSGLNLPLAQRIIALFGGRISVENPPPSGLKLTVRFKGVSEGETGRKACS